MSRKVLIVDDEADVRVYLTSVLTKHGYEVITAEDGIAGLEAATRTKPDLIVLDLMMPKQSGPDFYRALADDPQLRDTPVIIVSGLSGRSFTAREPVAVLDKPIVVSDFVAAVERALA
ncbi:response regulator [Planctomycetota bacterium]